MRKNLLAIALVVGLAVACLCPAAVAEDKGIIALQQSVSLLMSQVQDLQKSFNTSIGMMQGLVSQNTDTVNKLSAALDGIQRLLNGGQVVAAQHQSDISKQFQSLSDTIAALQAHLQQMDDTLKQIHQMQQTIPAPAVPAAGAAPNNPAAGGDAAAGANAPAGAMPPPVPAASTATALYQTALTDFQQNNPASQAELASFVRSYPNDQNVPDALYYLGSIFMQKTQYNEAIDRFTQVIVQYPDNAKAPLAELYKGISYSKQGDRAAAISELKAVSKNYPGTEAARQADLTLHSLERAH